MNYQISKSRMNNLVIKYLDLYLKNLVERRNSVAGIEVHYWSKGNEIIFEDIKDKTKRGLGISEDMILELKYIFSLSSGEATSYILDWVRKNLSIQPDFIEMV